MYIDTHAHIYSSSFESDQGEMLQRAWDTGVETILMPAIDRQSFDAMMGLTHKFPKKCLSMIGLHPCSVNDSLKTELAFIEQALHQHDFIGIGETGLDFYWDLSFKNEQLLSLEQHIEWALAFKLPLVLHTRNATAACIEVIKKHVPRGLKGVFHCFGGSAEEAQEIIDLDFYVGIGGVLTFKKSGLDGVLPKIPLHRIILETDAPYLAPVPYRGKRNEPAYLPLIAQKMADILELSLEVVASTTSQNAKNLFSL